MNNENEQNAIVIDVDNYLDIEPDYALDLNEDKIEWRYEMAD